MTSKSSMQNIIKRQMPFKREDEMNRLFTKQRVNEFKEDEPTLIIPLNTNRLFLGPVGSGKSFTMGSYIRSFILDNNMQEKPESEQTYGRYFNIHSENVDSTLIGYIPQGKLINVRSDRALKVLSVYISMKHTFMSYIRFIRSVKLDPSNIYSDHKIAEMEEEHRLQSDDIPGKMRVAQKFIEDYSKTFIIGDNPKVIIKDGFKVVSYDLFILDDLNLHQELVELLIKTPHYMHGLLYQDII